MAPNVCPACGAGIATADINVAEGVALCRGCGKLSRLSEVVEGVEAKRALDAVPPPGCRVEDDGVTWRAVASARSVPGALGAIFFAGFWNSVVGVFVAVVFGGLWTRLVGPLPSWAPSMSAASMPLGVLLLMTVFLTPFVAIGLWVFAMAVLCIAGHVSVTVRGAEGTVFTGVGVIGRHKRFDALAVKSVRIGEVRGSEGGSTKHIEIRLGENAKKLKFGSALQEERREWLSGVCRAVLEPGRPGARPRITEHTLATERQGTEPR